MSSTVQNNQVKKVAPPVPAPKKADPKPVDPNAKPVEAEAEGKAAFDVKTALDAAGKPITLDADGKLTGVPTNWKLGDHKGLRQEAFATESLYLRYRAGVLAAKSAKMAATAAQFLKDADHLEKFGDEKVRKKAARMQKMRDQYKALMAELKAEGVEFSPEDAI